MTEPSTAPREAPFADVERLLEDPHAAFARLRPVTPAVRIGERQYIVLRARDVLALATAPRTRHVEGTDYVRIQGVPDGCAARFLRSTLLLSNDAEHRSRRGPFAAAFAHPAMRALRPTTAHVPLAGPASLVVATAVD